MAAIPSRRTSSRFNALDRALVEVGKALEVLSGASQASRPNPAGRRDAEDTALTDTQRRHAAGLMRVNHVGEVCAQALYRGQAYFCGNASIRAVFENAAAEEVDHLAWCNDRLTELNSHRSYLNPLWYAGSFALGALASRTGTGRNLGFMAETEAQVEEHLDSHLQALPMPDTRSRAIVEQMRQDEISHRKTAERNGAQKLPSPVKGLMKAMAKVMTTTAYRI
jgi:ubiquinone biosynthesis monooxygenase Coq7